MKQFLSIKNQDTGDSFYFKERVCHVAFNFLTQWVIGLTEF